MDGTDLAHDMYKWRDFVNTTVNLRVQKNAGNLIS